jgi:insulin receptor
MLKQVQIKVRYSKGVVLEWEPFKIDDPRKLLGYIVYSIEAPIKNVTLYDGRDACGGDG